MQKTEYQRKIASQLKILFPHLQLPAASLPTAATAFVDAFCAAKNDLGKKKESELSQRLSSFQVIVPQSFAVDPSSSARNLERRSAAQCTASIKNTIANFFLVLRYKNPNLRQYKYTSRAAAQQHTPTYPLVLS